MYTQLASQPCSASLSVIQTQFSFTLNTSERIEGKNEVTRTDVKL